MAASVRHTFAWQTELVTRGLLRSDAITAPSRAFAEAVGRTHALRHLPSVVPNGRRSLTAHQDTPDESIFTAGRLWDEGKNVATLDRVAARLRYPFRAAGAVRGPHGESIALHHVELLGTLDETMMTSCLATRPIFVSAARYEPFGLSVLEAASAGCPLVLSDIPTFREHWGGVAHFVDPSDEDGFVTKIEALFADPARRMIQGERARTRAGAFYTVSNGDRHERDLYAGSGQQRRCRADRRRMKIVYFTHSLVSCWNHGNAHFLRGVLRELIARGHDVRALEPAGNWSLSHLFADHGAAGLDAFRKVYPELSSNEFAADADLEALIDDADVVIVHEWNEPTLVAAVGTLRAAEADVSRCSSTTLIIVP